MKVSQSALNGSASNLPDSTSTGRAFAASFSAQSGSAPVFHHSGTMQGLHNVHGSFNIPNMPGSLTSRSSTIDGVPSSGVQQFSGSLSGGRFASNNLPAALSQVSHGGLHGHSGVTNRGGISVVGSPAFGSSMNGVGGYVPGIPSTSAAIGNWSAVPGFGVSPIVGNAGPRNSSSMENIVGVGNIGRSISSRGGLNVPGLTSHVNLSANSGSGSLNVQGYSRLMSGVLQQAAPQVISMLGNAYSASGGPLSQNQSLNNAFRSMGINDMNSDNSPFDMNDFPQLTGHPSSGGGPQSQLGSVQKLGGVSSIMQQNQEFSIQNEDFPALPGFKRGNTDFTMDLHQKEQHHDNAISMLQSQHFPTGRSAGFGLGGVYASHRQQQHHAPVSISGHSFAPSNNQDLDLLHLHGSDLFPFPHGTYHSQTSGPPGMGLRPLNSPNPASSLGSYDQLLQQYQQQQQQQNQSEFQLQQMPALTQSYRDQSLKSLQGTEATPDRFGLLGLLSVIKMSDPDLTSLALGIDLTTLGLNLNSRENLHKTFGSPWSDEPAKGDPEYLLPRCYYVQPPPRLQEVYFSKFDVWTLFYMFYSMPNDETQLYAANELYERGWFYHKEHRLWFRKIAEPLAKSNNHERGSYHCFDPTSWDTVKKDNFVLQYDQVEKRPLLPQH